MHALAANWLIFLIVAVLLAAAAIALQLRNIHKIATFVSKPDPARSIDYTFESAFAGTVRRMIPVAICALLAALSGILFIVGVIANMLDK